MDNIWRIREKDGKFSDAELIALIKNGEVNGECHIANNDLKKWMRIKDTIYQFYLGGKNETI